MREFDITYDIPDARFYSYYKITKNGIVYDCKLNRNVLPKADSNGRLYVALRVNRDTKMKKKVYLDALLAFTFLNPGRYGLDFVEVEYRDGNQNNLSLTNLLTRYMCDTYYLDVPNREIKDGYIE